MSQHKSFYVVLCELIHSYLTDFKGLISENSLKKCHSAKLCPLNICPCTIVYENVCTGKCSGGLFIPARTKIWSLSVPCVSCLIRRLALFECALCIRSN